VGGEDVLPLGVVDGGFTAWAWVVVAADSRLSAFETLG